MDWQEVYGNWVLVPPRPKAVIHFLGGAFVATAPQVTYRRLLERLAVEGYAIVATPFVNTFDHIAIAREVLKSFDKALEWLRETVFKKRYLPIYGVGHSMGCKLHLLIGSLFSVERAGNILVSFNNFAAKDAVPLVEQLSSIFTLEFTPSPQETNQLVAQKYQVRRNLLVKFTNDEIDQTRGLTETLRNRFSELVTVQILKGTHLTPVGPDWKWQAGQTFTPLDAIAQWMRQEVYRELHELERTILRWLDPFSG